MSNTHNKRLGRPVINKGIPELVDRLNIGKSTADAWFKQSRDITKKDLKGFREAECLVDMMREEAHWLTIKRRQIKKPIKYITENIDTLKETVNRRGLHRKLETVARDVRVLSGLLGVPMCKPNDFNEVSELVKKGNLQAIALHREINRLSGDIERSEVGGTRRLQIYRRVQAAITSKRTDWTPIENVADHLESQYGVTLKQVAEWYGYDASSIYDIVGKGRFVHKRPKRAITLIDYYLKENELC